MSESLGTHLEDSKLPNVIARKVVGLSHQGSPCQGFQISKRCILRATKSLGSPGISIFSVLSQPCVPSSAHVTYLFEIPSTRRCCWIWRENLEIIYTTKSNYRNERYMFETLFPNNFILNSRLNGSFVLCGIHLLGAKLTPPPFSFPYVGGFYSEGSGSPSPCL